MAMAVLGAATVSVTVIGVVARNVDASAGAGESVRCTNAFAAAYSWIMFLASFEWLVVELAAGSPTRVLELLANDPRETVDPEAQRAGARICAFMFAYMVQDLVVRFVYNDLDFRYVVHHVACLVGLAMVLFLGHSPLYCVALTLSEFSTPVVCLLEVAQVEPLAAFRKYVEPCGVLLNLLFPLRICWFSIVFYTIMFEYRTDSLFKPSLDNVGYFSVATLLLVNWTWWFKLLFGTFAMLLEQHRNTLAAKQKSR